MGVTKGRLFLERVRREDVIEEIEKSPIILFEIERDILSFLRSFVVAYPKHDKEFIEYSIKGLEEIAPWKSEVEITDYLNEESIIYDDNPRVTSESQAMRAMKFLSKTKMVKKRDGEGWRITARGALLLTIDTKNNTEES